MRNVNKIFVILFALLLLGAKPIIAQDWQSCTYNASKDYGIYRIKNNTWRNQDNSACMWANSKDSWGADMNYPDGSYPWGYWEIFRGAHYGDVSPDPELPIKIADINELTVDWTQKQIAVSGNRVWSLIDLYAWKNADRSDHPKGHWNILVFTNIVDHTNSWGHAGEIQNRGTYQGKFNLGGVDWYVTHSPTPEFDHGGPTTSFYMADDYSHDVSVDLKSLFDFATSQGWGSDQWYFGSLQAGWETVQGVQEGLETTAFSTTLNGSVDGNGAGSCTLTTSESSHNFGSDAGSTTVDITTSESFTVTDDQSWISTSTSGNTVTVSVNENTGSSSRNGTVTITGCETRTYSVTQAAASPSGSDGSITVRARLTSGTSDILELRLDGNTVTSWTIGSSYAEYSHSGISGAKDVKIYFRDSGTDAQLDYINVNGTVYQAEDQSDNTSAWDGTCGGGSFTEEMHCRGHIGFGTIDFGSGTQDPTYTLTVNSGSGDGDYEAGTSVNISADAAPSGQQFSSWTGDVANVVDVNSANTSISMPSSDATISATYEDTPSGGDGTIIVRARLTSGSSDILELRLDGATVHSWTIGSSYAEYSYSGISGSKDVKINFKDQGTDAQLDYISVDGTVYQAEDQSVNTSAWANGACGGGSFTEEMHCPGYIGFGTINFGGGSTQDPTYTLTVNNGSGDGDYEAGTSVNISADAAPSGQQFSSWTGDISNVNDVTSASTTITMPSSNVTISATYEDIPSGGGTVTVDDQDASIVYAGGGWVNYTSGRSGQVNETEHETNGQGDYVELTFTGTGIELIARTRSWGNASAPVSIDGNSQGTVSFNGGDANQQIIYSNQSLSNAQHTIRITNDSWDYMFVDAFKVTSGSGSRTTSLSGDGRKFLSDDISTKGDVLLYPNPVVDGILNLELKSEMELNAQIFDINGQLLLSKNLEQKAISINVSALKSGMHFLRLESKHNVSTYKFIIGN